MVAVTCVIFPHKYPSSTLFTQPFSVTSHKGEARIHLRNSGCGFLFVAEVTLNPNKAGLSLLGNGGSEK